MDILRLTLDPDYRATLQRLIPGLTSGRIAAFDRLIAEKRFLDDDGAPTPDLVAWVRRAMGGDDTPDPAPAAPPPGPAPCPVSNAFEVVA